jgi:uncharacterized protein involved in propanediol utilization
MASGCGVGLAPGTFGELMQGVLDEPRLDFQVTLSITRGTRAVFDLDHSTSEVCVQPSGKWKSAQLAARMLSQHGLTSGGRLILDSDLPEGKGMGSSSADLVATARAVGAALGVPTTASTIELLLREIEPSDGVMYAGAVAFCHREVRLLSRLGPLPPLAVVGIDEGGMVDTLEFNRHPKPYVASERQEYARLLHAAATAIRIGDPRTLGWIATRSAILNQRMRRRPALADMVAICERLGGLGVVAAHSGTVLGVLLSADNPGHAERVQRVVRACEAVAGAVWIDYSLGRGGSVRYGRPAGQTREEGSATACGWHRCGGHRDDAAGPATLELVPPGHR